MVELPTAEASGVEALVAGGLSVSEKAIEHVGGVPVIDPMQIQLLAIEPGAVIVLMADCVGECVGSDA